MKFALGRVENIVGKGEKYWLLAFSPIPKTFSNLKLKLYLVIHRNPEVTVSIANHGSYLDRKLFTLSQTTKF